MSAAIRKYSRDFIALIVLAAIGLGVGYVILQNQRLRIPVLEEKPFELRAEFETAQAIMAGQGQTVRVAGVRIGDIMGVELKDGKAIVEMDVDREFLPIYRNATILMRPKTGLKDMFLELDPGDRSAGEVAEGAVIPSANTEPDVNQGEFLSILDADTQDYLKLLISGAARGLEGRSEDLGNLFKTLAPLNRESARLNREVAQRRTNISRYVHNFNRLMEELGRRDDELTRFVEFTSQSLGALAQEEENITEAVARLPGTLSQTRRTLEKVEPFARDTGATLEALRPWARRVDRMNAEIRPVARDLRPIVRHRLRPFARDARRPVRDLTPAVGRLAQATPDLETTFGKLNRFFNMLAYNPGGAEEPGTPGRTESYLFWAGWLSHQSTYVFANQDAHGLYRRLLLAMNCESAADTIAGSPLGPAITQILNLEPILEQC